MGFFEVRDITTKDAEYSHDYNVIQHNICTTLQVWAIHKKAMLWLCLNMYILISQ